MDSKRPTWQLFCPGQTVYIAAPRIELISRLPCPPVPWVNYFRFGFRFECRPCSHLNFTKTGPPFFYFTVRVNGWLPTLPKGLAIIQTLSHSPESQQACWAILFPGPDRFSLSHDWSYRNKAPLHFRNQLPALPHTQQLQHTLVCLHATCSYRKYETSWLLASQVIGGTRVIFEILVRMRLLFWWVDSVRKLQRSLVGGRFVHRLITSRLRCHAVKAFRLSYSLCWVHRLT